MLSGPILELRAEAKDTGPVRRAEAGRKVEVEEESGCTREGASP